MGAKAEAVAKGGGQGGFPYLCVYLWRSAWLWADRAVFLMREAIMLRVSGRELGARELAFLREERAERVRFPRMLWIVVALDGRVDLVEGGGLVGKWRYQEVGWVWGACLRQDWVVRRL